MLKFWELGPSPNNIKVRMALRFKGIEFEARPVDARDRSDVLAESGQELTPLIADRGIVLNDSEAILQYLDANYRDTPRLFPEKREGRKACDAWKRQLDKRVARPWSPIFFHAIGAAPPFEESHRQAFAEALHWLEQQLGEDGTFHGPERPVCDLRAAEWAVYGLPGEGLIARCRLFRRFKEHFGIAEGSLPRLEQFLKPWNARLA